MSKGADKNAITVAAVLKYARELRERAQRARVRDPYATPYEITDQAARKVSQQHGPAEALRIIAARAVEHELKQREGESRATRAASELLAVQMVAKGEREATVGVLSLGQRLDAAFRGLSMLSETPALRLDGDRVTGSRDRSVILARRRRERFEVTLESLQVEVRRLVERAERELDSSKRRLVEERAA